MRFRNKGEGATPIISWQLPFRLVVMVEVIVLPSPFRCSVSADQFIDSFIESLIAIESLYINYTKPF